MVSLYRYSEACEYFSVTSVTVIRRLGASSRSLFIAIPLFPAALVEIRSGSSERLTNQNDIVRERKEIFAAIESRHLGKNAKKNEEKKIKEEIEF